MFRRMFDSVTSSLTARVDDLVKTVAELKASIEFTQSEVANLKPVLTKLEGLIRSLIIPNSPLLFTRRKKEYMENQSRRNNIRVQGISEAIMERHGTRQKARLRRQLEKLLVLIHKSGREKSKASAELSNEYVSPTNRPPHNSLPFKGLEAEGRSWKSI